MERYDVYYCQSDDIYLGYYEITNNGKYKYKANHEGISAAKEITVLPMELTIDYQGQKPIAFLQHRIDNGKKIGRSYVIGNHTDYYRLVNLDH